MNSPKYEIPQRHLTVAIEGLLELARRLTDDAVGFTKLDTPEAKRVSEERLEQAKQVRESADFYLHL